ncbi:MAG: hypothetical protein ACJ8AI_03710 [Rhodopila sp.]
MRPACAEPFVRLHRQVRRDTPIIPSIDTVRVSCCTRTDAAWQAVQTYAFTWHQDDRLGWPGEACARGFWMNARC